jgi:hypothetical protein
MDGDIKSMTIVLTSGIVGIILIVSILVGQSMYSDYLIAQSIKSGTEPMAARCAFGAVHDVTVNCQTTKYTK